MPKENRRTKITKLLLNESFLQLLSKKPLTRITVKEICEDADLNRSTYYQYFADPYDQMMKLEADTISGMVSYLDTIVNGVVSDHNHLYTIIKHIIDYIQSKKKLFQILLSNNGDISLQKDILTVFFFFFLQTDIQMLNDRCELLQEYIFFSSGSFGLIYYWLMSDEDETTDALAKRITSFVERIPSQI